MRPAALRLAPLLAGAGLLFGGLRAVQQRWLSDDLFITIRYCDNVLAGLGPVYNAGERVEGYTHFLWFTLLTVGRATGIAPHILGQYLGIPAYLGVFVLLVRIGGWMFPSRSGWWGVPVAALAWALHVDAQRFASGGLETPFFTFLLLLGFELLCNPRTRVPREAAAAALALATLTRPEGALFSVCAAVYSARARGWVSVLRFAAMWTVLVAPQVVFRLLYYGDPLPNPYYAKSARLPYWSQGLWYLQTYFRVYFGMLLFVPAFVVTLWGAPRPTNAIAHRGPLRLAALMSVASLLATARLGGDYMFARFLLPVTPLILILVESLLQRIAHRPFRIATLLLLWITIAFAPMLKARHLSGGRYWNHVADEPSLGTLGANERHRRRGEIIRRCIESSGATVLIQGGQCTLAYYSRFPRGIEIHGLTDRQIAHSRLTERGRPGHEKNISAADVFERPIHFRFHYGPVRIGPQYRQFAIVHEDEVIYGEIFVYKRELMEKLLGCSEYRCLDFPSWLRQEYVPSLPSKTTSRLMGDYADFRLYYFDRNADTEGLQAQLEDSLRARGVIDPRAIPLVPALIGIPNPP